MVIFNNLVINANNATGSPYLFNLTSFRRCLISHEDLALLKSMLNKSRNGLLFSEEESSLYNKLISERQILHADLIKRYNDELSKQNIDELSKQNIDDILRENKDEERALFTIQLTQECNMGCSYCYEKRYLKERKCFTREMIDHIKLYYEAAEKKSGKEFKFSRIRITGGEPMLNSETVGLINYIAETWKDKDLYLLTNGTTVSKYYNEMPWDRIKRVNISLDGVAQVHMQRRYPGQMDTSIYDEIIAGIKQLLSDNREVSLSTVIDKRNYKELPDLYKYLKNEQILGHPKFDFTYGVVADTANELSIDEEFNDICDIKDMKEFLTQNGFPQIFSLYPSLGELSALFKRKQDKYTKPRILKCNTSFCSSNFFSPNGNVYFCDCIDDKKGIVGTFYPNITFNDELIDNLSKRNPVFNNEECKACDYKYVCLGGCPLMAIAQDKEVVCGAFNVEEIMDNLSYEGGFK